MLFLLVYEKNRKNKKIPALGVLCGIVIDIGLWVKLSLSVKLIPVRLCNLKFKALRNIRECFRLLLTEDPRLLEDIENINFGC